MVTSWDGLLRNTLVHSTLENPLPTRGFQGTLHARGQGKANIALFLQSGWCLVQILQGVLWKSKAFIDASQKARAKNIYISIYLSIYLSMYLSSLIYLPILSYLILSYPILSIYLSYLILSYPILSIYLSYLILSCPVLSCPVLSCPILSYPILSIHLSTCIYYIYNIIYNHNYILYIDHPWNGQTHSDTIFYAGTTGTGAQDSKTGLQSTRSQDRPGQWFSGLKALELLERRSTWRWFHQEPTCHSNRYVTVTVYVKHPVSLAHQWHQK